MNEGEYLELADQFKEIMNNKDNEIKKQYEEIKELKKILDELVADDFNQPNILVSVLEILRGFLSSAVDRFIFNENPNEL